VYIGGLSFFSHTSVTSTTSKGAKYCVNFDRNFQQIMATKAEVRDAYFRILTALYSKHNTEKLSAVDALLTKYKKDFHALYKKICKKYGVRPMKKKEILAWREEQVRAETVDDPSTSEEESSEEEEEVPEQPTVKEASPEKSEEQVQQEEQPKSDVKQKSEQSEEEYYYEKGRNKEPNKQIYKPFVSTSSKTSFNSRQEEEEDDDTFDERATSRTMSRVQWREEEEVSNRQGPGSDASEQLSNQKVVSFFQNDYSDGIDLSEGSTIEISGRTLIFPEPTTATVGTRDDADNSVVEEITSKSEDFVNLFNEKQWNKIPSIFSQDCVISVSDRNYYGREAAEIVFKAIRTQAGRSKSGCGPSLEMKRSTFEILSKRQIRENGVYKHNLLEKNARFSFTWKLEKNRYQLFLFQW